jgi:lipoprotein-anchoring transpeptidase ErfK/SrfK
MAASATWRTLCKQAEKALAAGQRGEARRLAQKATKLAPDKVEPWLLLASLTTSAASQAYVRRAVANNPRILRAVSAIRWAEKRSDALGKGATGRALPKPTTLAILSLLGLTVIFAVFAWLRPPVLDEGLRVMGAAAAQQLDKFFATETSEPAATFTATFTPFATRTVLPSSTPTSTPTSPPTMEPSPEPIAEPGLELSIEKFDLDLPRGLDADQRWIDINLSEQTLSAFEGAKLINSFLISSGTSRSPTVTGEFEIWIKVRIQAMSGPGYYIEDVPWVMYFYGDYGIHGTWWHNNFGTPMSAGCVNMSIPDAQWMYQWASVGTVVKVHY